MSQTEEGQQTLFELQQHMSDAKGVFLDQRVARNILERMDETLGKVKTKKHYICGEILRVGILFVGGREIYRARVLTAPNVILQVH